MLTAWKRGPRPDVGVPESPDPPQQPESTGQLEAPEVKAEVELLSAERLIFFSDAVVAIAITLLALDLPVPVGATNADVLQSAEGFVDQYVAFVISFVVIAGHWRGHHRLFRYVNDAGPIVPWNLLWLFFIVVMPFATRVLNGNGAFQVRFTVYAGVQALAALSLLVIDRSAEPAPGRASAFAGSQRLHPPDRAERGIPGVDPGVLRDPVGIPVLGRDPIREPVGALCWPTVSSCCDDRWNPSGHPIDPHGQ